MAKGKKTGGRNFQKGEGGRKPLPDDIKAARNLSYEDMCRTVIKVRQYKKGELDKIDKNKLTLGELAIINAYEKLDYQGIKCYEDRLWGKAKETIDANINTDNRDLEEVIKMTNEFIRLNNE
jgi:hypothetical protein